MSQDEEDPPAEPPEVTLQLRRFGDGDEQARAELMRVIEPELRRLAAWQMRGEHGSHTLQTTALVNEAYIRLFGSGGAEFNGRNHFLSVASRVMRQVLVDYARARHASKRDGEKVSLNSVDVAFTPMQPDLLDVHRALLRDLRQRAVLPDRADLSGRTAEPRGGIVCQRRSGEDGVVRGLGDAADFAGPVDLVGLCAPTYVRRLDFASDRGRTTRLPGNWRNCVIRGADSEAEIAEQLSGHRREDRLFSLQRGLKEELREPPPPQVQNPQKAKAIQKRAKSRCVRRSTA